MDGELSGLQDGDVGERATDINTYDGVWHAGSDLRGIAGRVGWCEAGGDFEAAEAGIHLVIVLGPEPFQLGLGQFGAMAFPFRLQAFLLSLLAFLFRLLAFLFRLLAELFCTLAFLLGLLPELLGVPLELFSLLLELL